MKTLEAKSLVLLHHHLKALRLPTIGAECEKVAAQAAADNVDHLTTCSSSASSSSSSARSAPPSGA